MNAELATGRVAVIGAGPVGLAVALALADQHVPVLLLDSGMEHPDPATTTLTEAEIADPGRHAPMPLAVMRGFGGTSRLWGGRCLPFDGIDFTVRPYLKEAAWPLSAGEVTPWYDGAARFLDCGQAVFEDPWPGPSAGGGLLLDRLERWCAEPNMARAHGERVRHHSDIATVLGATALRLDIDAARRRVRGIHVARGGETHCLRPRAVVIACGGVDTARLMLASRVDQEGLFGGPDGALGRYYMAHIYGSIADIVFRRPGDDALFDYRRGVDGRYFRRRMGFSTETLLSHGLANIALWPELPEGFDPRHKSGILSLAHLALASPVLGERLVAPAIRRRKLGAGPTRVLPHLTNIFADAPNTLSFAARFLKARYLDQVRVPGFFARNSARRYAFFYHGEHAPIRDSRVSLSHQRDALGMPRARIDLRFTKMDAESVLAAHDLAAGALDAGGLASIVHRHPPDARLDAILAAANDGFHQIGTARMGVDAHVSVVDRNCVIHGVDNLFVAGSAVFPSSGQANPTFLAVALALRLADFLPKVLPSFG